MKTLLTASALMCALFSALAQAQTPTINAIENNYSYTPPGLPNYGIAQGSIFVIFGANLAASSTGLQAPPLKTTLNGVTVNVAMGGTTRQALLYYVTPTQIAGILPSNVPAGTGQLTVTSNGATSAPSQIIVVPSAFGILTLNNGSGPAAAFDSKNQYLGSANAANPGDTIIIWGTGAGPVADDNQQSAVSSPPEVTIGGVVARVLYAGRSQYPGLDQINVVVPSGLSGCYVSVVVRSGTIVSNFSSIPVAGSGRTCTDQAVGLGYTPAQLQALAGKSTYTIGSIGLTKIAINTPAVTFNGQVVSPAMNYVTDSGFASFQRITLPPNYDPYVAAAGTNSVVSVGNCTVYSYVSRSGSGGGTTNPTPTTPVPTTNVVSLNAGPNINVTGPNGTKAMPFQNGSYTAQLGGGVGTSATPEFIPAGGGTFTLDNGSGGPDLGAFRTQLTLTPVVWSNRNDLTTINRSQGATVTWTGGDPGTWVLISGASFTTPAGATGSSSQIVYGSFTCTAPASAGRFTVPSTVLLALPPSGSISAGGVSIPQPGTLSLGTYSTSTSVSIPGVDLALALAYSFSSASPNYQ